MRPSCRLDNITSFLVMDVLERAHELESQGADIIHLEIGEPDFDTPEAVNQAARQAIADGHTHYTNSLGLLELRTAICEYYDDTYGVALDPDQIIVTSGTSPAMLLCFSALMEPGDNIIVSDPSYACYSNFVEFVSAQCNPVQVFEEDGFQYRVKAIEERLNDRTRAILINSPSNPTGTLLSRDRLERIAGLGVPVVSDEIYHGLVYGGEQEHSILEFTDNAFVLNGFSKLYAMTGWRLGYLIAPKPYMPCIRRLAQNLFICAGSISQWAGIAALKQTGDDVAAMKATYDERRRYMVQRLRDMGLGIAVEPKGAFYVLANCRHLTDDSLSFAFDILEKAHVGVTPGIDFGKGAEGYIRFSYANSLENIREGLDRVERYIQSL